MNKIKLCITILIGLAISACSLNGSESEDYRNSPTLPTIEVPPDLSKLDDSQNLDLPGSELGKTSLTGRPVIVGEISIRVLPKIDFVQLEGQGDFHWLNVGIEAEKLYREVRTFWQEEGFLMVQDEPVIGVMETGWIENSSGIVASKNSSSDSQLNHLPSNKTEDRYRTRLERDEIDKITRIYITHRRRLLINVDIDKEGDTPEVWQSGPNDSEAEVEMLSRLMIFLGLRDPEVKIELAKYGLFTPRAYIVKNEDEEATYLLINQAYNRAWNRALNQLSRMDLKIGDTDIKTGLIEITKNIKIDQNKTSGETSSSESQASQTLKLVLKFTPKGRTTTRIDTQTMDAQNSQSKTAVAFLQNLHKSLK